MNEISERSTHYYDYILILVNHIILYSIHHILHQISHHVYSQLSNLLHHQGNLTRGIGLAGRQVAVIGFHFHKIGYSLGFKITQFSIT